MRPAIALIVTTILLAILPGVSSAYDATRVQFSLLQKLSEDANAVTVASDSAEIPDGSVVTVRLGNVVCDLSVLERTEADLALRIETITSGPNSKRVFRTYRVPFEVPVILDSLVVKGESFYRFSVTATGVVSRESFCDYSMSDSDHYSSDPAPHFQIHFVRNSLGDFHWNAVRRYLELEYDAADEIYDFDYHQPMNLYLMPCRDPNVNYDSYYGFSIDPVRNNILFHYSHDFNALTSIAVNMMQLYRFWGYAPASIVEAAAALNDFNDFFAVKMRVDETLPSIQDYFLSHDYLTAENREQVRQALGSFVEYLIDTRNVKTFRSFYSIATDLTVLDDMEKVYGKPAGELISGWHNYLDTLTLDPGWLTYQSQRVAYQRRYDRSIFFLEEKLKLAGGDAEAFGDLANFCYTAGRYQEAEDYYRLMLESSDNPTPTNLQTYANFMLINGRLEDARRTYEKASELDSSLSLSYYKLGRIADYEGNADRALSYYHRATTASDDDVVLIDAQIALGRSKLKSGDKDSAEVYLGSALNGTKMFLMSNDPEPLAALRAGEAFLYLEQAPQAIEQLEFCVFVEERPFYIGRAALALGKAYDLMNDRDKAIKAYELVRTAPGGFLFVQEADRLLRTPFTLRMN